MSTALATQPAPLDPTIVAQVLLSGDLERLNDQQRMAYCTRVCESLGLNPLTQPFAFIRLNGKLVMYAKKDATEQLRSLHQISIDPRGFSREVIEGVYVVTAPASTPAGRTDVSTGCVPIDGLKGEARANAMMKAETKAKRRVTLSICGLGILDETEVESVPPPMVVEAPKAQRVELPDGAVHILKVEAKSFKGASWADVTFVTSAGEEKTLPTEADGKGGAVALCEQLAQEGKPVWITTKVTPRSKKTVINQVLRQPPTDAELDAEIVAKEAEVL
jgi:hypothetical protein